MLTTLKAKPVPKPAPKSRAATLARLAMFPLALLLAMTTTVVTGATAAHASGWYCGDECNGEDPQTYYPSGGHTPCANDAETHYQTLIAQNITVELRYSPSCRTIWGRAWGGGNHTYVIYLKDQYFDYYGPLQVDERHLVNSTNWGNMHNDAGVTIWACVSSDWNYGEHTIGCTSGGW